MKQSFIRTKYMHSLYRGLYKKKPLALKTFSNMLFNRYRKAKCLKIDENTLAAKYEAYAVVRNVFTSLKR